MYIRNDQLVPKKFSLSNMYVIFANMNISRYQIYLIEK